MTERSPHAYRIVDEGCLHKYRTEIPNTVIRGFTGRGLSLPARWLYVYLKSVAGDQGECWQNTTTIAKGAQLGRGTISDAKQELIKARLIAVDAQAPGSHETNRIRILDIWDDNMREFAAMNRSLYEQLQPPPSPDAQKPNTPICSPHEQICSPHEQICSPHEQICSPHEQICSPHEQICSPHEPKKISLRRSQEEDLSATHSKLDKAFSPGFERFWQAYPLKKGKGHAWSAWRKLELEPLAAGICASIQAHQTHDTDWQRGFIKHPSSYLNGRCWEDEFPTTPTRNSTPKRRGLAL